MNSIAAQTIKPQHVYVVIPHGYAPPEATLGYEEVIYTEKGMWQQRMYGMQFAAAQSDASEYQLVCDDDVTFDSDFAENLMAIADKYSADGVIPIQNKHVPVSFLSIVLRLGAMRVEKHTSKYKISILKSAGFQVNNGLPNNVNPTQSGPFACFLFRSSSVSQMKLEEEKWLDETPYALPDDQVFFYKAHLCGLKVFACNNPQFKHLDGGSSDSMRAVKTAYSGGRNYYIFWRKFIYNYADGRFERFVCILAIVRRIIVQTILYGLIGLKRRSMKCPKAYVNGLSAGVKYFKDITFKSE